MITNFFLSCRFVDDAGKYGTAGQATDDSIMQRTRCACWITKATNTHSEYEYLLLLHCNNGHKNAPQCYIIRTLPVLFSITSRPSSNLTKSNFH